MPSHAENLVDMLLCRLRELARDQGVNCSDTARFVLSTNIVRERPTPSTLHIRECDALERPKFTDVLATFVRSGPSWIHANLIRAADGEQYIEISFGDAVGNPSPHCNVSVERRAFRVLLEP